MGKLNGSLKVTLLFFKEKKITLDSCAWSLGPVNVRRGLLEKKKSYVNDKIGIFCQ